GGHAPGIIRPRNDVVAATHHVLMAHGKAVQAIRSASKTTASIGWAPVGVTFIPETDSPEDIEAARRLMFDFPPTECDVTSQYYFNNSWYSDAVIKGEYPESGIAYFGNDMVEIQSGDMELISQPLDFYGVNIYFGSAPVSADPEKLELNKRRIGEPRTMMGWPVTPEALYWGPRFFAERYGMPLYITENGCAGMDWIHTDGKVHDHHRIDFLTRYLKSLERAIDEGIDVRGYFQWSIMDNYEWAEGYSKRFGLVYVDYETQCRVPKDSYEFYQEVIKTNGSSLPDAIERPIH
ncbi:MAG: family 1 glycosylhydrolase, partial [Planctomycetota bacterium]